MQVKSINRFLKLLHQFGKVERVVLVKNEKRWENDVEHSYQLAMLVWHFIESQKLKLKKDLAIKYALIHDLVEVYAGDTYLFTTDKKHKDSQNKREVAAAKRIKKEFPELREIHKLIKDYSKFKDPESKFVYALDKVIPAVNIYLDKGRSWRHKGVTLDMLVDAKKDKVALSPPVAKYFWELVKLIKKDKKRLFH